MGADVDEVVEIERIEIVEVVEPGHNDFLKKRRSIIIASMAVGCFILFALSVLISSRVSCICSKPDRKKNSKKKIFLCRPSQTRRGKQNKMYLFKPKNGRSIGSFCPLILVRYLHLRNNLYILNKRQLQSHKFIHSSHQLKGKLLCYLCTVKIPRPLNSISPGRSHLVTYTYTRLCFC